MSHLSIAVVKSTTYKYNTVVNLFNTQVAYRVTWDVLISSRTRIQMRALGNESMFSWIQCLDLALVTGGPAQAQYARNTFIGIVTNLIVLRSFRLLCSNFKMYVSEWLVLQRFNVYSALFEFYFFSKTSFHKAKVITFSKNNIW